MREHYAIEVGVVTVSELVEILQSLPEKCKNWPVYCCGTDAFLCVNEKERNIVIDMEDASGRIKYHVDGAAYEGANEYDVVAGSNTFTVRLTAGEGGYNCLELGGLGNFKLTFTGISLKEVEASA